MVLEKVRVQSLAGVEQFRPGEAIPALRAPRLSQPTQVVFAQGAANLFLDLCPVRPPVGLPRFAYHAIDSLTPHPSDDPGHETIQRYQEQNDLRQCRRRSRMLKPKIQPIGGPQPVRHVHRKCQADQQASSVGRGSRGWGRSTPDYPSHECGQRDGHVGRNVERVDAASQNVNAPDSRPTH